MKPIFLGVTSTSAEARERTPADWPDQLQTLAVNEAEGAVLAVIAERQPITRYELVRTFQLSPSASQNASKGSLYPLVGRMVERNYVSSAPGKGRQRAEVFSLTAMGERALYQWVMGLDKQHILPLDPLMLRVLSLSELTPPTRVVWVASAKRLILEKAAELQAAKARTADVAYSSLIYTAYKESLDAKLRWLDLLLIEIASEIGGANTNGRYGSIT